MIRYLLGSFFLHFGIILFPLEFPSLGSEPGLSHQTISPLNIQWKEISEGKKGQRPQSKETRTRPDSSPLQVSPKKSISSGIRPLSPPHPRYPLVPRRLGQEGSVTVKAHFYGSGKIRDISIVQSSGFLALDREAVRALREAILLEGRENTYDLPSFYEQEFTFKFELQ